MDGLGHWDGRALPDGTLPTKLYVQLYIRILRQQDNFYLKEPLPYRVLNPFDASIAIVL